MSTAQRVSRGFHRLGLCLMVIPLVAAGVPLAPQAKKPTLYVDKVERGSVGEVIVIYNYQTQFPPDPEEVLQVARAQCRQDGYADAAMGSYPTLRQCTAVNTCGGTCARERATDSFSCRGASTN